tara:strand:- start:1408 stop:1845 length:438 start_codon:yes stop_codon:yes gene_type:complete
MKAVLDEKMSSSDQKEITVEQKLQVSIPIPENSKYLVDKTVIFGEGAKFSGILYLQHEETADDIITFYRKNMIADGWSEIGIVRSKFILVNYEKENRFATIKVIRTLFEKSDSEITIGPKSSTQLEKSLDGNSDSSISDEPFIVE